MKSRKLSDARSMSGGVLVILSTMGLFVIPYVLLSAVLLGTHLVPFVGLIIAACSVATLVSASSLLAAPSLYWQIPLQAVGLAAIVAGAQALVLSFIGGLRLALGFQGLVSALVLLLGVACCWLMKHLQARLLPGQDA